MFFLYRTILLNPHFGESLGAISPNLVHCPNVLGGEYGASSKPDGCHVLQICCLGRTRTKQGLVPTHIGIVCVRAHTHTQKTETVLIVSFLHCTESASLVFLSIARFGCPVSWLSRRVCFLLPTDCWRVSRSPPSVGWQHCKPPIPVGTNAKPKERAQQHQQQHQQQQEGERVLPLPLRGNKPPCCCCG